MPVFPSRLPCVALVGRFLLAYLLAYPCAQQEDRSEPAEWRVAEGSHEGYRDDERHLDHHQRLSS